MARKRSRNPDYAEYLASDQWQEKRIEAIESSGSMCERCGLVRWVARIAYDCDLNVHHKTYKNVGNENLEDLEVLCKRCHDIEHFGKSDLQIIRETLCPVCSASHWDRYSDLCPFCRKLTSYGGEERFFFFLKGKRDPKTGESMGITLLRVLIDHLKDIGA